MIFSNHFLRVSQHLYFVRGKPADLQITTIRQGRNKHKREFFWPQLFVSPVDVHLQRMGATTSSCDTYGSERLSNGPGMNVKTKELVPRPRTKRDGLGMDVMLKLWNTSFETDLASKMLSFFSQFQLQIVEMIRVLCNKGVGFKCADKICIAN